MMVRKDVFAEWGWPGRVSDEGQVRLRLEDIMMDAADDRLRGLWLKRSDGEVRWNGRQDQEFQDDERLKPVVVAEVGEGGWGQRVYMHMVPATKASAWGVAGMTHLVAQKRGEEWGARRLHKEEIRKVFESNRVQLELAEDEEEAVSELGNAGPARMVQPHADGIMKWMRPQSSFVPESIQDIVPVAAVEAVRGTMEIMYEDFQQMRKHK